MRLQLALNVPDLAAAIMYYERLFGVAANKRKPGYANFAITEPPLKLVLFENPAAQDRLNHLGVEVVSAEQVQTAATGQRAAGLAVTEEIASECCFASQNKAVTYAPDGTMWEFYNVIEDLEEFGSYSSADDHAQRVDGACC